MAQLKCKQTIFDIRHYLQIFLSRLTIILSDIRICKQSNRPFYRHGGHIEFIRFKEYYGMHRGHSLSIYARFSGKKRTSMYISREKGDRYYIQRRHNDLFFSLQSFFFFFLKKNWPEKRAYICILMRVYWIALMPSGHPTILLKSN